MSLSRILQRKRGERVKTAFIFGAGEYGERRPQLDGADMVIAADGGYDMLARWGVTPDLLMGDFDSLGTTPPEDIETVRHPVMKDDTDMALAADAALSRGAERLIIYGGLGGRPDHSFANIQLAAGLARRGVEAVLVGADFSMTAVCSRGVRFEGCHAGTISVFAVGGTAQGVTERGLLYRLDNAELSDSRPMGVSNSFTGARAEIETREGTLLIMWQGDILPQFYDIEA